MNVARGSSQRYSHLYSTRKMNTDGCAPGWATDEVFIAPTTPGACDMPVAAWTILCIVLVLGKAFVVFKHVTLWRERARKLKQTLHDRRHLVPFVPTLGIISFLIYFIFLVLTCLNLANSRNGWAPGLYAMGWFVFGSMSIFYFIKMLRLGKRLIPLSKKDASAVQGMDLKDEALGKFDTIGKILFVIECFSVVAQFVLFTIVGVAVTQSFSIVRAGFSVMAVFLFVHTMSVSWLIERTITAIKRSRFRGQNVSGQNSRDANGEPIPPKDLGMRKDIQTILRKMREQQAVIAILAFSGSLVYVLMTAEIIPSRWFVILIHMYYDLVSNLVIVFSMGRKGRKGRSHQPKSPESPNALRRVQSGGGIKAVEPYSKTGGPDRTSKELENTATGSGSLARLPGVTLNTPLATQEQPSFGILVFQSNAEDAEKDE